MNHKKLPNIVKQDGQLPFQNGGMSSYIDSHTLNVLNKVYILIIALDTTVGQVTIKVPKAQTTRFIFYSVSYK